MKDITAAYDLEATANEAEAVAAARLDIARQRFLIALLLSTWVPMLFFFTLAQVDATHFTLAGLKTVFLFLGTAHVPATLFFYTDKNFAPLIRQNKARYIYFPLALTVIAGLVVAFSSLQTQVFLFLTFWGWQAFHYGRQNVGIYSFTSIAQGTGGPHKLEKLAIDLATVCGILGTFRILGIAIAPSFLHGTLNGLFEVGKIGYFVVIIFAGYVYLKNFGRTTLWKSLFFWTLVLFFLPIYLSNDINVTFLSYAIAHGLQYMVFMGIVSMNTEEGDRARGVNYSNGLKLTAFIVVLGLIFYNVDTLRGWQLVKANALLVTGFDFLFGAVLGATMAHFVIDAGAWRLSKAPQREYMSRSFGFVFTARKAAG